MQAVATIVHACGHLRHHPDEAFLEAVERHAQTFNSDYTCANWSALLQTFTMLQAPANRLYSALLQQVNLSVAWCGHMCLQFQAG